MAGLLGNIDLTDPNVALAAGLLSGRGNLGANLSAGLLGGQQSAVANRTFQMNQQAQERANRQNDLLTLSGLYKNAITQDAMQAIRDRQNGVPHVTNPALGQLQQKMNELAGLPSLSGGGMPAPPMAPQPQVPSPQVANTPAPTVGQNFLGANPNFQPLPTTQAATPNLPPPQAATQSAQPQGQGGFQDLRDEGDLYALMGMNPIAENRYKLSSPALSRGVSFDPRTGMPIAGFVDNVPVKFDAQGNPQVIPNQIGQAIADRAGAVAGAQAGARAPFDIHEVTLGSGATVPMSTAQIIGQGQRNPLPTLGAPRQIPQGASQQPGSPFVASGPGITPQAPQPASQPQDPWATVPKIQTPQTIGYSAQEANMNKARGDAITRLGEQYNKASDNAQTRLATNNQALDLANRADTGTGAAMLGDVKTLLVSRFGIPESDFKNDPAATTALNKDLMNAAITKAKSMYQGAGRMTQQEVMNQIKRGAANGDMLLGAIKFLLQSDNASARYDLQQANDFGRYLSMNGDPLLFPQWYAGAFPLSKAIGAVQLPPNTAPSAAGWSVKRVQ